MSCEWIILPIFPEYLELSISSSYLFLQPVETSGSTSAGYPGLKPLLFFILLLLFNSKKSCGRGSRHSYCLNSTIQPLTSSWKPFFFSFGRLIIGWLEVHVCAPLIQMSSFPLSLFLFFPCSSPSQTGTPYLWRNLVKSGEIWWNAPLTH